jgi:hypothetical protein
MKQNMNKIASSRCRLNTGRPQEKLLSFKVTEPLQSSRFGARANSLSKACSSASESPQSGGVRYSASMRSSRSCSQRHASSGQRQSGQIDWKKGSPSRDFDFPKLVHSRGLEAFWSFQPYPSSVILGNPPAEGSFDLVKRSRAGGQDCNFAS